jgi:hypothetical protein
MQGNFMLFSLAAVAVTTRIHELRENARTRAHCDAAIEMENLR